jgi:hypothetical protein
MRTLLEKGMSMAINIWQNWDETKAELKFFKNTRILLYYRNWDLILMCHYRWFVQVWWMDTKYWTAIPPTTKLMVSEIFSQWPHSLDRCVHSRSWHSQCQSLSPQYVKPWVLTTNFSACSAVQTTKLQGLNKKRLHLDDFCLNMGILINEAHK